MAVGDFEAEFDAEQSAREREETKRLMYVAFTRARDRLYLASATTDGVFKPRNGSLGEVLPESIRGLFASAAAATADGAEAAWPDQTGASHIFRICVPADDPEPRQPAPFSPAPDGKDRARVRPADDFGAVADNARRERVALTRAASAGARGKDAAAAGPDAGSGVVLGRVVHRMFQAGIRGDLPPEDLAAIARGLVMPDEAWTVGDLGSLAVSAARVYSGMWSQPALRAVLDGAECHYEVPVSVLPAPDKSGGTPRILRGVVDCLACRPNGRVVVVDFKTGAPRKADRRQLRAYVGAVRLLYPGSPVEGRLVYPETES